MELQTTKVVEATRELLKAFGYFVDNLWHVDDVHFMCEQHGFVEITDTEAMEVFHIANMQFDGEHGLSWPQIERALRTYMQRKILVSSACESTPA